MRLATEAIDMAREHGLLERVEVGEIHTALGVALAAEGRREEALTELEQGMFLRRLWGQSLDLVDGLLALAPAVAALGDRARAADLFAEAQDILAACREPGALPGRLAAARRATGRVAGGRASGASSATGSAPSCGCLAAGCPSARSAGELFLSFNTVHTHVRAVYRKLGVTSRAEAVARARRERLI